MSRSHFCTACGALRCLAGRGIVASGCIVERVWLTHYPQELLHCICWGRRPYRWQPRWQSTVHLCQYWSIRTGLNGADRAIDGGRDVPWLA
jgi:hypothetical protein